MENHPEFYTLRGYNRLEKSNMSPAMEDYLEMICRILREKKFIRVNQLASLLNVTPPSASKMVSKLKNAQLINFEPYGIIQLTKKGEELGNYFLYRHQTLHEFFCIVNSTENELELVEKIEHFIDSKTVQNMENWIKEYNKS